jgi:hypothetical protein
LCLRFPEATIRCDGCFGRKGHDISVGIASRPTGAAANAGATAVSIYSSAVRTRLSTTLAELLTRLVAAGRRCSMNNSARSQTSLRACGMDRRRSSDPHPDRRNFGLRSGPPDFFNIAGSGGTKVGNGNGLWAFSVRSEPETQHALQRYSRISPQGERMPRPGKSNG